MKSKEELISFIALLANKPEDWVTEKEVKQLAGIFAKAFRYEAASKKLRDAGFCDKIVSTPISVVSGEFGTFIFDLKSKEELESEHKQQITFYKEEEQ